MNLTSLRFLPLCLAGLLTTALACSTGSGGASDASVNTGASGNGGNGGGPNASEAGAGSSGMGNPANSGGDANTENPANPGDASSSDADGSAQQVSCDPRNVRCRMAETPCPEGEVHTIINGCYGPCVKITECACDAPEACPHTESYTCWKNTGHCNFYGP